MFHLTEENPSWISQEWKILLSHDHLLIKSHLISAFLWWSTINMVALVNLLLHSYTFWLIYTILSPCYHVFLKIFRIWLSSTTNHDPSKPSWCSVVYTLYLGQKGETGGWSQEATRGWGSFCCSDIFLGGGNSNILCYFHPYLLKWSHLTHLFWNGLQPQKPLGCRSIGLPYRTRNAVTVLYIVEYSCVGDCQLLGEHPNRLLRSICLLNIHVVYAWFVILAAKKTNGIFFTMPLKKTIIPFWGPLDAPVYISNILSMYIYIYIYIYRHQHVLPKKTYTYLLSCKSTCHLWGFGLRITQGQSKRQTEGSGFGAVGIQEQRTSLKFLVAGYEDLFEKAWNHHRSPEITVEEVWLLQKDDCIGWLDGVMQVPCPLCLDAQFFLMCK